MIVVTKSALGAGNTGRAQGGIQAAIGDDDSHRVALRGHLRRRPPRRAARAGARAHRGRARRDRLARVARGGLQPRRGPPAAAALRRARAASGCCRPASAPAPRWSRRCARRCARAAPRCGRRRASSSLAPRRRRLDRDARPGRQRRARARCGPAPWCSPPAAGCAARPTPSAWAAPTTPTPRPRCCAWRSSWAPRGARSTRGSATRPARSGPRPSPATPCPETTRGYGATLHDADGERFVDELAPRDVVAQGIIDAVEAGRGAAAPDGQAGRLARHARHRPRERRRASPPSGWPTSTSATSRPGSTSPASGCWSTRCSTTATAGSRSTSAPPRRCRACSPRARSPAASTAPTG